MLLKNTRKVLNEFGAFVVKNANHNNILSISFKMYFDEIEKFLYSIYNSF